MDQQAFALIVLPVFGGLLGGLACADLRAEQHGVEAGAQPCQRGARGARPALPRSVSLRSASERVP